jgi:hypothetical protein
MRRARHGVFVVTMVHPGRDRQLDHVATVSAMTELAGRLPNAALTVLPGAEHITPFVEPKALAGLLSRAANPA